MKKPLLILSVLLLLPVNVSAADLSSVYDLEPDDINTVNDTADIVKINDIDWPAGADCGAVPEMVNGETITDTGATQRCVPAGVTSISIEIWGAGGTGGVGYCVDAGEQTYRGSGPGGGGGGYSKRNAKTVSAGDIIDFTIAATGDASTTADSMTANTGNAGDASPQGTGGTASGGDVNTTGGNGVLGSGSLSTSCGAIVGGTGGSSPNGGAGGSGSSTSGAAGTPPGGGGGGGGSNTSVGGFNNGGAGANGGIKFSW